VTRPASADDELEVPVPGEPVPVDDVPADDAPEDDVSTSPEEDTNTNGRSAGDDNVGAVVAGATSPALAPEEAPVWGADTEGAPRLVAPRIPGYKVHALLGRGATGIVYRATQLAVDRQVALKVLHPELVPDRRAVLRLQREARLAARLAHPTIITAIDMGEVGGRWWYAMELVAGISLQRRLATRGPLSERECLRIFSPLCDALQHAHEVGIVHRDIKPANILIDRRGRARLVDLGLAMSAEDPTLTRTGGTLGTPHYVSPEQARDPRRADTRSDLWSLGATMYHAVAGRPPFEGTSVAEILSHVLHDPVPDPREFAPNLSKGFALMLGKCLTRDPERRYQEPWELVADIELLRERRRPDVRAGAVDAFASRRPTWLGPLFAVLGSAALVVVTWLVAARPWEPDATPQRPPTLEDWPELVRVRDLYQQGALSPAAALEELDSASLAELPEEARFTKNGLVNEIKLALDERVAALRAEFDGAISVSLQAHDFERVRALVGDEFSARLRTETGFDLVERLPRGSTRHELEAWSREVIARADAGQHAAFDRACVDIVTAYPATLGAFVADSLEQRNWRAPWELLDRANSALWLEMVAATVDLRGLDERQRDGVAARIVHLANQDRTRVQRSVQDVLDELLRFIESERDRLSDAINDALEDEPGERLREAFERKREGLGLEPEHVPANWMTKVAQPLELAVSDLEREAQTTLEETARAALVGLQSRASRLRAQRRYEDEAELWAEYLLEPWRRVTHPTMRLRLREAELLAELLGRAARAIDSRTGEKLTLEFEGIHREGEIESLGGALLHGFGFKVRGQRLRVLLRGAEPGEAPSADTLVLGPEVILTFAAPERSTEAADEPTSLERLAVASFLLSEGRAEQARAMFRIEAVAPADAELASDLEQRIRRALEDVRSEREERDLERKQLLTAMLYVLRGELAKARKLEELDLFLGTYGSELDPADLALLEVERKRLAAEDSFESAYGVPNLDKVGRQVRLLFDFSKAETRGTWRAGDWVQTSHGLSLLDTLTDDTRFLAGEAGPLLALVPPLRVESSQSLRVRLTLRPDADQARGQLFAVTVAGYHLVLRDSRAQARAWFGSGDLRALVERINRGPDQLEALGGFTSAPFPGLPRDKVVEIDIKLLLSGTLDEVLIDGRPLAFSKQFEAPVAAQSALQVRSREAATLLTVEIIGKRQAHPR
jgi:tRNA A-37 threonylcarbamoyl transferase component Bud32